MFHDLLDQGLLFLHYGIFATNNAIGDGVIGIQQKDATLFGVGQAHRNIKRVFQGCTEIGLGGCRSGYRDQIFKKIALGDQGGLDLFAFGDVAAHAEGASKLSIGIVKRHQRRFQGASSAVFALNFNFAAPTTSLRDCRRDLIGNLHGGVRRIPDPRILTNHFGSRIAKNLLRCGITIYNYAHLIADNNAIQHGFKGDRLATQFMLNLLGSSPITHDQQAPALFAVAQMKHRLDGENEGALATFGGNDHVVLTFDAW